MRQPLHALKYRDESETGPDCTAAHSIGKEHRVRTVTYNARIIGCTSVSIMCAGHPAVVEYVLMSPLPVPRCSPQSLQQTP